MKTKKLLEQRKFFELWYDREPNICQIQLDNIDKQLL